ncbi:phosphohexomutase domain-containing protein [Gimesia algae]|uniref:hypothetical protein n=1 Tax=Gimesia algae TaxID=2527971 RepID=UPI0018D8908D|nr:hypothetical protein [Gimesia algae]
MADELSETTAYNPVNLNARVLVIARKRIVQPPSSITNAERIFGAYDIRGVVSQSLDSRNVRAIAGTFGNYLCPEEPGRFLIGHDTRLSSPAVSVGLREEGHQVVKIGLATTPMVYWYGADREFDGSVMVTARHLQPEYNGLKLCERDAKPLSGVHGLPEIAAAIANPPGVSKRPISQAGGNPIRTCVGHAFIKLAMRKQQALFAVELSGYYYYSDLHFTDNGLRTLIELINLVSAGGAPLSEMLARVQIYHTSGEINQQVPDRDRVLDGLKVAYHDGQIDHLDGLSVDYPDWWFNVCSSLTEPLLRINLGASRQDRLEKERKTLFSRIDHIIDEIGKVPD